MSSIIVLKGEDTFDILPNKKIWPNHERGKRSQIHEGLDFKKQNSN